MEITFYLTAFVIFLLFGIYNTILLNDYSNGSRKLTISFILKIYIYEFLFTGIVIISAALSGAAGLNHFNFLLPKLITAFFYLIGLSLIIGGISRALLRKPYKIPYILLIIGCVMLFIPDIFSQSYH